ncbi:MAG: sel1 repeat family protein [Sulfurimonas sp.]|nr:sel1 repeat family protein [Sulfurimonas sp.]
MFKCFLSIMLLTLALQANYYEKGDEAYEEDDIIKAVSFWEKGSNENELASQFMLGLLYLRGEDIAKDNKKAAVLLAKTFNQNDETVLITIALTYYKNMSDSKEDLEAIRLFEEAINKEGKTAQYNLGMLFLTGNGVNKDAKKGNYFINLSKR